MALMAPLEEEVTRILAYYDVFDYPLDIDQISSHTRSSSSNRDALLHVLDSLVTRSIVRCAEGFYSLSLDPAASATRRLTNERHATRMIMRARRIARFLKHVPYVRGIFVTGSLSKWICPPEGDIDFMIVTEPGRLWIVRLFLTLIKKSVFLNHRKYFCINLLVANNELRFERQNFYQAVEVASVMPVWNAPLFREFHKANLWVREFIPRWVPGKIWVSMLPDRPSLVQKIAERLLNLLPLESIDGRLRIFARRRWRSRYARLSTESFDDLIQCKPGVSTVWANDQESFILNDFSRRSEALLLRLSA